MNQLQSFPPLATASAHTLILGSMPGSASLSAEQYYAHPRNLFWPLMGELLGFAAQSSYPERVAALTGQGYALWDVLDACRRSGSLDSAIETDSMKINDFARFLTAHPHIDRVFFNGAFAEGLFRRRVLPTLGPRAAELSLTRLPSTSPANAAMSRETRRAAWEAILR